MEQFKRDDILNIKADGTIVILPDNNLETTQKAVGGYIKVVSTMNSDYIMLVNEEGAIHSLPHNKTAGDLTGRPIVGDVVLLLRELME